MKKLHASEKRVLDEAVRTLIASPDVGQMKKGDLAGVRVYKFKHLQQQMLLTYAANTDQGVVILLGYGAHENFYRDLKH